MSIHLIEALEKGLSNVVQRFDVGASVMVQFAAGELQAIQDALGPAKESLSIADQKLADLEAELAAVKVARDEFQAQLAAIANQPVPAPVPTEAPVTPAPEAPSETQTETPPGFGR